MIHNFDEIVERRGTDAKKYADCYYPNDVQPMWIADTDFRAPELLVKKITERVLHGIYGYPYDQNDFSEAACGWLLKRFGYQTEMDSILYTPGVIPGIICSMRAFSNPGDQIVLQTPTYPPFRDLIINNGRRLCRNPLKLVNGRFEIDFEQLEEILKHPRTSIMILCNPHNPTGRVFAHWELLKISMLCRENHVFLISDEIHCDLTYGNHRHIPLLSLGNDVATYSAAFINPSKTFNIAGFRTAAVIAPDAYIRKKIFQELENNKGHGRNVFGPLALVTVYRECEYYADQLKAYLEENKCLIQEQLVAVKEITVIDPEATYLIWLDCRKMNLTQQKLMDFFVKEAKLGLNDGLSFGKEGFGFVRMNIACPRTVLREAIQRIKGALAYE